MSTKGLKQLSVRAKLSISALNPFFHAESSRENHDANNVDPSKLKENDAPDLEEFGSLKSYTDSKHSEVHPVPAKDSPSRRKKLMGSLRSMSSLRIVRSPPKEESKESTRWLESTVEPESPCTPSKEVTPSLALNFQQSPVDQPMFDLQRRSSVSSSLHVHHSSPMAIPRPAQHALPRYSVPAGPSELPVGTVPTSPGPLQIAMRRDTSQPNGALEAARPDVQTPVAPEPLPTPMPGTNFGFSQDKLAGIPQSARAQPVYASDHVDYFNIPIPESSGRTSIGSINGEAVHATPVVRDSVGSTNTQQQQVLAVNGISNTVTADDSSIHDIAEHKRNDPNILFEGPERELSPLDIDHIVYEDYRSGSPDQNQTTQPSKGDQRTDAHTDQQMQRQPQPSGTDALPLAASPGTWGTHGSLYDGTGYGDGISSRPSTSSTAPKPGPTPASSTVVAPADLFAEESAAMARDHETLEEVIRAYASFEEDGVMGVSEEILEDVVADVELANRLADHSLGA
ncbi:hypothetical protein BKA63DRAFT_564557 [Paraphoma chrysanthemicola]|nr:hypothetical protein BKA63DRAFT_564557 [Paraphoma chrysanthemicola]